MKTFIPVLLLVATSYSQPTKVAEEKLAFKGALVNFQTAESEKQEFTAVSSDSTSKPALTGTWDWMVSVNGVNFLSLAFEFKAPAVFFATCAVNSLYF